MSVNLAWTYVDQGLVRTLSVVMSVSVLKDMSL